MARVALLSALAALATAAAPLALPALQAEALLPPGQLAALVVPPALNGVVALLPTLSGNAMPADVKPIRKAVLNLRNLIDIFSFAYPMTSPTFKSDPLPYIRDLLDEGYEQIGACEGDLEEAGVNYTKKELVTRRCTCLVWEADWEEKSAEHQIEAYLTAPLLTHLETGRPASHLSSFFWRNTGFVPKESDTGLHTVTKLQASLLKIAQAAYAPLIALNDMTQSAQQTQMHDYRKQLRGILAIASVLPVWNDTAETELAVDTLTMAYDGLGQVEDDINAYIFEVQHSTKDEQKAASDALAKRNALVQQLEEENLEGAEGILLDSCGSPAQEWLSDRGQTPTPEHTLFVTIK